MKNATDGALRVGDFTVPALIWSKRLTTYSIRNQIKCANRVDIESGLDGSRKAKAMTFSISRYLQGHDCN